MAVNNWLERKGDIITADSAISLKHYASRVDISHETLRKYVCADVGKRRVLGACAGSLPVISVDTEQFTVDVIRRKDRANDGLNRREAVDMLQDLRPDLKRTQLMRAFDRNIRRKNADVMTGIVKAQASTVKRSAITVPQQYRWFMTIEHAFDFLRKKNTGLTPDGKSFGEVMAYFVLGGDETGLHAPSQRRRRQDHWGQAEGEA